MNFILFVFSVFMVSTLSAAKVDDHTGIKQTSQTGVENGLRSKVLIKGNLNSRANILDKMLYYKVPGVGIAVVNNGKIEWSTGYGHITNDPKSARIDEKTLFQAGSISKPITAFGALLLVQQGRISLDADVNLYLKRWKVPENEFTKTEKVTLRRLLSHTAGTNVQGFPGYSLQASIPTIIEILQGKKPIVNTDPIIVISKPGSEVKYSGGGTTIVQLLIEDVTGEHFDDWMQSKVLEPLGMLESTFKQPLPQTYADHAAHGHHQNGVPVEGKWHNYPEMAAAGLWSTPKDLAKFIIYIQEALKDEKIKSLNPYYVKEMITHQKIGNKDIDFGLGLFLKNEGKDLIFGHDGQDEGFIARLTGYAYRSQGVVIMMNNDFGWVLMDEIINSVADTCQWPHFKPIDKKTITIDPSTFSHYPGQYLNGEDKLEIITVNNKLFIDLKKGLGPLLLLPFANCIFFIQEDDLTIEFLNCEEKPNSLTLTDSKGIKTVYKRQLDESK